MNIQSKTSEIKVFPYLGLYYKYKPISCTQELNDTFNKGMYLNRFLAYLTGNFQESHY